MSWSDSNFGDVFKVVIVPRPMYGPGWRNTGSVQFEPVQIQFSKFSQSPNCEPELPAVVRTRTRTELELTVQFGQFGPNRRFGTELRQPYVLVIANSESTMM